MRGRKLVGWGSEGLLWDCLQSFECLVSLAQQTNITVENGMLKYNYKEMQAIFMQ